MINGDVISNVMHKELGNKVIGPNTKTALNHLRKWMKENKIVRYIHGDEVKTIMPYHWWVSDYFEFETDEDELIFRIKHGY